MRLSLCLFSLAATPLACLSLAAAQTPSVAAPQGTLPAPPHVQVQVQVQPAPAAPAPSTQGTAQPDAPAAATQPYAIQPVFEPTQSAPPPYSVYVPAPPAATPLPSSAVLLLPQDLLLAGKGSWERRGNELFLHHSKTPGSRRSGLIAGGIVLLSVGYAPALIMGGLMTMFEGPSTLGSSLFLPVAGPFLSGFCALSRCDGDFLGSSGQQIWAWTWMMLDGAAQVAGLAMIIAGARSRPGNSPSLLERVHILPYSTQQGGGVTVSGRF
ncbi:MAG: hypothetical protein JNJ46_07015 [Myxococcales bacterium]|nr:hypothetical protein [Myxococcales bacterium]